MPYYQDLWSLYNVDPRSEKPAAPPKHPPNKCNVIASSLGL
jgi:hypothetical protein